jgi:hypothetical protein
MPKQSTILACIVVIASLLLFSWLCLMQAVGESVGGNRYDPTNPAEIRELTARADSAAALLADLDQSCDLHGTYPAARAAHSVPNKSLRHRHNLAPRHYGSPDGPAAELGRWPDNQLEDR